MVGLPQIFRFLVITRTPGDPRSTAYLADAHALGFTQITKIICNDLYFIAGQLDETQLNRLAREILSDPITQRIEWTPVNPGSAALPEIGGIVEVGLRVGVTDPVSEQIIHAAHILGLTGVQAASTGLHFQVEGSQIMPETLRLLSSRLLSNTVIQRFSLGEIEPAFPEPAQASGRVEIIPIRTLNTEQLLACSNEHRAALDRIEMQTIQAYFQRAGRDCTDIEFECIAQTWSEHCVHKTFKALISVENPNQVGCIPHHTSEGLGVSADRGDFRPKFGEKLRDSLISSPFPEGSGTKEWDAPQPVPIVIDNILNTYIRSVTNEIAAPWVISAFSDNAGIIEFNDEYEVSFKVETHNHPSAIEPFGGANTGVGGVIRDVLGVSAKPIANTDVLCFGPTNLPLADLPEGVLHPRRIQSGVIAGVQDYGNKMGIPTVNGAIWYDPGFTANPLVFCGCVGLAPRGLHVHTPQVNDRVIVLGGRTGRDGLRGATFSSQTMDAQTGAVAGASVQIGDPITEKKVQEVILIARDEGLYHAITDCGAGGLSSAVGEMSSKIGAEIELAKVQLKYPGLAPWEIWLSEAQERMVIAVAPNFISRLQTICDLFEVELTDIGFFSGSARLLVCYNADLVLDLENQFLHDGLPQRRLKACPPAPQPMRPDPIPQELRIDQIILDLLNHPNIASKAATIRIYDHEVQGGTRVKPLSGIMHDGPSDACVIKPIGTPGTKGIVISNGLNPEYGKRDPYAMAVSAIDEAVRNAVAVGADPDRIAILDNFCWGDPLRPEVMWSLLEAARGCHDAALAHRTPFISGKDSFNNEYLAQNHQRVSIPPTLLISAIGVVQDIAGSITLDLKTPANPVYLVGEFQPTLGGSHFCLVTGQASAQPVPCAAETAPQVYHRLHQAVQAGWIRSAHDLSEGGLSVAAAEMAIAGRLGLNLDLPGDDLSQSLFGETNGCLLVEVAELHAERFEAHFSGLACQKIGRVTTQNELSISHLGRPVCSIPVDSLVSAWVR